MSTEQIDKTDMKEMNENFAYDLVEEISKEKWELIEKDSKKALSVIRLLMEQLDWDDIATATREGVEIMAEYIDDEILQETLKTGIKQLEHNCIES